MKKILFVLCSRQGLAGRRPYGTSVACGYGKSATLGDSIRAKELVTWGTEICKPDVSIVHLIEVAGGRLDGDSVVWVEGDLDRWHVRFIGGKTNRWRSITGKKISVFRQWGDIADK